MPKATAPENARCPECGTPAPDEQVDRAVVHDRLENNGYLHGDFNFTCPECDYSYVHGVPVGDFEGGTDLWCGGCETYVMVHRVVAIGPCQTTDGETFDAPGDGVLLHTKCPGCYRFEKIKREPDRNGVALVGYPSITGEVNDETRPYGWEDDPPA